MFYFKSSQVAKPPRRPELDSIEKDMEDVHDAKQTLLDETAFCELTIYHYVNTFHFMRIIFNSTR